MKTTYKYNGFLVLIIFILISLYFITSIVFDYITHNEQFKVMFYSPIFQNDVVFILGLLSIPILGILAFLFVYFSQVKANITPEIINSNFSNDEKWKATNNEVDNIKPTLDEELNEVSKRKDINDNDKLQQYFFKFNNYLSSVAGIYYSMSKDEDKNTFCADIFYMIKKPEEKLIFEKGEGIIGEVAKQKKIRVIWDVPAEKIQLSSGLGKAVPHILIVIPILNTKSNDIIAIMELAFFEPINEDIVKKIEVAVKTLYKRIKPLNL